MCCRIVRNGVEYKPGDRIPVRSATREGKGKWAGFARSETAQAVWGKHFNVELDIPADYFAENNRITKTRVYSDVNQTCAIMGLGNRATGEVKVLTREASKEEKAILGHHRVPMLALRRF